MTPEVIVLTEVMKEPTIFTHLIKEPVAIIAVCIILLREPIKLLFKWVVSKVTKKKTKSVEQMFHELDEQFKKDKEERIKRQAKVDGKLDAIQGQIDVLSEGVAYLDNLRIKQSQGIFEDKVFMEPLDPYRKLKAFRRLLGLRGNGEGKLEGFKTVRENPKVWIKVLELKMPLQIVDYDYYKKSIQEINAKILDHGLTIEPDDTNAVFVKRHLKEGDKHE